MDYKIKLRRALDFAAGPASLARKFWSRFGGLINFVCSSLGLPSMWTQLVLAGSARAVLFRFAVSRFWVSFVKNSPLGSRAIWTDGSLEHLIECPDPAFGINDRKYLAAVLGFSRVLCSLFIDSMSTIFNLLKGKIPLSLGLYFQ